MRAINRAWPSRVASGLLMVGLAACHDAADTAPGLTSRFESHSARVLGVGAGFTRTTRGFVPASSRPGGWSSGALGIELPELGKGVIHLRVPGGLELEVREIGASGEGRLADRAVVYPRAGGASFWTASPEGLEEWLRFEAGATRPDRPAAAWVIEGGALREVGESVEITGGDGVARLAVTAPAAYGESGGPIAVRLRARGDVLELYVDARGEALVSAPGRRSPGSTIRGCTTPRSGSATAPCS